jgi:hypothetical protein
MNNNSAIKNILLQTDEIAQLSAVYFSNKPDLFAIEKDSLLHKCRELYNTILAIQTAANPPAPTIVPSVPVAVVPVAIPAEITQKITTLEAEVAHLRQQHKPVQAAELAPPPTLEPIVEQPVEQPAIETPQFSYNTPPETLQNLEKLAAQMQVPPVVVHIPEPIVAHIPDPIIEQIPDPIIEPTPEPLIEQITPAAWQPTKFSLKAFIYEINADGNYNLMLRQPIDDLKKGIGLNEKFMYIRELFENEHQNFTNEITALNNQMNIEQANELLTEMIHQRQWDTKNEYVASFLMTVYRRFHRE